VTDRPLGRLALAWALALLVALLAVPLGTRVGTATGAVRFLVEFLTEGRRAWLSRATPAATLETLALAEGAAMDLWRPGRRGSGPGLLLVHGLTPAGKADARIAWTAERLARTGQVVAVPDLPGLRAQRLRPDDARVVRLALDRLAAHPGVRRQPVSVLAVSVGLAPVALALADRPPPAPIRLVVALGGYAEARELVRYFTTGAYGFGELRGRAPVDPALARDFLASNLDLVRDPRDRAAVAAGLAGRPAPRPGPEARAVLAVLANRDPARVDALLAALPAETQALLDALSPARQLRGTRARLVLVHGRDDPAIPHTESLRLAAAAPGARVVLVDLVAHVEGRAPTWRRLLDFARLWSVGDELLAG
jgi:pimeloyl-ACP methyl ester carboxylesterase